MNLPKIEQTRLTSHLTLNDECTAPIVHSPSFHQQVRLYRHLAVSHHIVSHEIGSNARSFELLAICVWKGNFLTAFFFYFLNFKKKIYVF
jgi:hypothetical protein